MSRAPVPEGSSVDAQAFSVFFLRAVVQPSFLLRVVYKAALVARAANCRRDDVREMPYLPRDAHVTSIRLESACFQTLPRYTLRRSLNL